MPKYTVGKQTSVKLIRHDGEEFDLSVPVQREGGQLKTGSVYVVDNGRPVVFIEFLADSEVEVPFSQGEPVGLVIDHGGEPGLKPIRIERGVLDIIGVDSSLKSAVKCFVVVASID